MGDAMVEIVFVEIGIHPRAVLQQDLVVLRAGQRSQEEELEEVERQLALDDFDVAEDRFLGVARKAQDVAGIGGRAVLAPLLQHVAILGDLVLALLGRQQIVGIDVLKPDKDAPHAGLGRLLDEIGNAMAQRVDLDGEADIQSLAPQLDQAVEQLLPVPVAGKIVVGDEEPLDALGDILAHEPFEIVGRAKAALAPLHIDDRAERALVRAAAAEIDAR